MNELRVAIIGQGRSGRDIHGKFFKSERNDFCKVVCIVEADDLRRKKAAEEFGCDTLADYTELFGRNDIDVVVNASYSQMHYPITKDLLLHGFNVLVEKPFGRNRYECDELIKIAKEKGLVLAVFQQTFFAPFYTFAKETVASGKLGDIKQVSICYSGFARRWDWQTLQRNCAGSTYNTGPHPIGLALGFLDFDKNARVIYSKLDTALTSGDADDYSKILITAPNKPLIDIEISSIDAYANYVLKIQGSKGTFKVKGNEYEMTYIVDGENEPKPVVEGFIHDENRNPIYCSEKLIKHTESGKLEGTAFDVGTSTLYKQLLGKIKEGKPMEVTPEMAADIISVIETVHAQNPLPLKF